MMIPDTKLPRASLGRVLEELGTTLLHLLCGDATGTDGIGGVVIHDPLDRPELPDHAMVLGVGLHEPADVAQALADLGRSRAAALVVRAPFVPDETVLAAARDSGTALLAVARGASWTHLAGMLRTLTADAVQNADPGAVVPGRFGAGDLFAVANATAALLDAPVTIEDRNSRLLAFSSRQDHVDPSRVQTILGRQVPPEYTRILEERGVFREIYRSDHPVFVDSLPGEADAAEPERPRAVIAVRAGDEILGTVWVVVTGPLDEQRSQVLHEASKLIAMHMVWQRADADRERRLRAELLATALESGPEAPDAVRRLGLRDGPAVVLALTVVDAPEKGGLPARLAAERGRLADAFAMHLAAVHPSAAAALIGDTSYGVLPVPAQGSDAAEERAAVVAAEFLTRVGSPLRPVVGVGRYAADSSGLARSRTSADRALRVLRRAAADAPSTWRQVARLDDVHSEALLLELADVVPRGELPSGVVGRLAAYDARHQSNLVETLGCWLDALGDIPAASAAMFVHPNTFRYRLKRVAEVGVIDLEDPDARLAAMLQLKLLALRPGLLP
ncbi:helix-turn-helix domain-containing protein [Streptomyces sp. NPDC051976]|uniref:PucR family transcriptional regulator n=1 Tax=Streptomyces sp. NPDC051976 TaxID=3154947 RepID=UPI0034383F7F